jgi:hypothetical protein
MDNRSRASSRPRFLDPDLDPEWGWDGTCWDCEEEVEGQPYWIGGKAFCEDCADQRQGGLYEWDGIECDPDLGEWATRPPEWDDT